MASTFATYKPGGPLVQWLSGLLVLGIVMGVIAFASEWSHKRLLNRYEAVDKRYEELGPTMLSEEFESRNRERDQSYRQLSAEMEANDVRQVLIGLVEFALFLLTSVFFLRSLSRANRNARAMGAREMQFTPGWCIGWFFVPIANLFMPFQAVKETWLASTVSDGPWQNNPSSPLLGIWWILWIVNGILGQIVFHTTLQVETFEQDKTSTNLAMISDALWVPLAFIALLMIRRLFALQDEKFRLVGDVASVLERTSCRHCGEPVAVPIGDCPMCGEALGDPPADPRPGNAWQT